jgi:hypothetical protein
VIAVLVPRESYPGSSSNSEHKENFDLGHAVCQALTGAKLHRTNINDNSGLTCRHARVKGIGPGMSEVSDVQHFRSPFYDEWMGTRDRLRTGLSPLLSVAWHFLSTIENAGE